MQHTPMHAMSLRIYYEDTDAAGVVYYANYLKYAERGRTEMLRQAGIDQSALMDEQGIGFVVRRVEADFKAPARLDDLIAVTTRLCNLTRTRLHLTQDITCGEKQLVLLAVEIVAVDRRFKPAKIPESIFSRLSEGLTTDANAGAPL